MYKIPNMRQTIENAIIQNICQKCLNMHPFLARVKWRQQQQQIFGLKLDLTSYDYISK